MGTQGTGRKRNPNKERSTVEDDALNLIAREAEARLAAKRAARAEAREIRMKELERQQKEIYQVQKKYYGLDNKLDDRADAKWGDIEQWMEDSERYSRPSRGHTSISDEEEHLSVGLRGSVRVSITQTPMSTPIIKPVSKFTVCTCGVETWWDIIFNGQQRVWVILLFLQSSRLSDESRATRSSRLDLTSSKLSDESRLSRSSRLDLQSTSYGSSDLHSLNGVSSSKLQGSSYNGYQPAEYRSYRGSSSRSSSRASSARTSPVDDCSSVASFLRSAANSRRIPRDLDDVTIPDLPDAEDRDYLEKGSRTASIVSSATLASLGGTSSRRGSGETSITADTETSIREIKEIHELKDQIQDVETKYMQNLKEVKDALVVVEEKYRKAMVSNAQLDNEKNNLMYHVDTLKDSLMELEELLSESRREYEDKAKEYEREKHTHTVLQFQFNELKETVKQSEELLTEIRQLRLKQEGFVREVSDLQETVEWKDKKIAALERQKEYSDAVRTERDELRDEVVQLKDILKKHGIVLGPDLSVNGGTIEPGSDGPVSGDPASRPALDLQTSPTEGNSMLGRADEMQLDGRGELDQEQQQDMHDENCPIYPNTRSLSYDSVEEPCREEQGNLSIIKEEVKSATTISELKPDVSDFGERPEEVVAGDVDSKESIGANAERKSAGDLRGMNDSEQEISSVMAAHSETQVFKCSDDTEDIRELLEPFEKESAESCETNVKRLDPKIRLRKLVDEREKLIEQVKKQKAQLEQSTQRSGSESGLSPDVLENGTDPHLLDLQRDANRQISDLKFKLVKIEQEATASEQNVIRLDAQVMRYKSAAENAEKVEDELKAEKRKLQRELRAALDKIDEVESNNSHLSKRLEKMKANRTAPTP
ncbi:leucine-rich repeat flightless-interacting protein 2 [Aplochiton taeniatus]